MPALATKTRTKINILKPHGAVLLLDTCIEAV